MGFIPEKVGFFPLSRRNQNTYEEMRGSLLLSYYSRTFTLTVLSGSTGQLASVRAQERSSNSIDLDKTTLKRRQVLGERRSDPHAS